MASWNEIRDDFSKVANKAIKKTGELAEGASVHVKIRMTEAKLSAAYEKLGKLTYKQLKTSESQAESISETIATIDSLREEIKALRATLEEMKKAREAEKAEENIEE